MTTHRIISPIDGSVVAERELASDSHIETVLSRANAAQRLWQALPVAERARLCEALIVHLETQASSIAQGITWQMGRPLRYTPNEILRGMQERARYMISIAATELENILVPEVPGFTKFIQRTPVGTVLIVAPWNYPYLTAINSMIPALLAGNTVVMKHASQTLLCAEQFSAACAAVGFPNGVFQHIHADHAAVEHIIKDPRINFVVFTGSVQGGAAMEQAAVGRFIGVGTELGGKDPSYVRADADIALAVAENVDGAFFNSGQSCCGIERIYVHDSVYDDFVEGFVALTKQYVLGNPLHPDTTIGPMVNAAAADFVRKQIVQAMSGGAQALVTEQHFPASAVGTPYMGPTVLIDVDHTMDIMTEESFGPVIGIMRVSTDDEAISLMNDSPYGLTASVWTTDIDAAIRIGQQIETGTVFMNRCDYVDPTLVWTGVKDTGCGIALSQLGFAPYTRPKSFHLKH